MRQNPHFGAQRQGATATDNGPVDQVRSAKENLKTVQEGAGRRKRLSASATTQLTPQDDRARAGAALVCRQWALLLHGAAMEPAWEGIVRRRWPERRWIADAVASAAVDIDEVDGEEEGTPAADRGGLFLRASPSCFCNARRLECVRGRKEGGGELREAGRTRGRGGGEGRECAVETGNG